MPFIAGAVEGISDEAVFHRLVASRGGDVHRVQVQGGKPGLRRALPGYNSAARHSPWLVLVDLDREFECAAALVANWLPRPSQYMRFRVVVRAVEAWLMADRDRFSAFFSVTPSAIPSRPDELADPKGALLGRDCALTPVGDSGRHAATTRLRPAGGRGIHIQTYRVRWRQRPRMAAGSRCSTVAEPGEVHGEARRANRRCTMIDPVRCISAEPLLTHLRKIGVPASTG